MRHWMRSYWLLLVWTVMRVRKSLPVFLAIQTLMSVGIVVGFSLIVPSHDRETALYLSTGAPTIALITVGMVLAPQMVAQQKFRGLFDYQRSMPVPRLTLLAADATVWVLCALPGMVASLLVGVWRFDLTLAVSPWVVPATLLAAATTVTIGYTIAYVTKAELISMVTNVLMLVALLFAPVNYPAERLPGWLAAVHQVLPFEYMAQAMRDTVNVPAGGLPVPAFAVLGAWAVAGLAVSYRVMTRRV